MKKPAKTSLFKGIKKILLAIANEANFGKAGLKKLEKISQTIFSGTENDWQKQFKFDISFNIDKQKAESVRFSCNNRNEPFWDRKNKQGL